MDDQVRKAAIGRLRPWFGACVAFLHLDHWRITLEEDMASDTARADIRRWRGQLDAEIRLGDEWFDAPEIEQRQSLCHELLHAHMRPLWEAWIDLDDVLGKPAYALFSRHMGLAEEQVVEALAKVLAPLLPALPPTESKEATDAGH